jgi:hypothetical protein
MTNLCAKSHVQDDERQEDTVHGVCREVTNLAPLYTRGFKIEISAPLVKNKYTHGDAKTLENIGDTEAVTVWAPHGYCSLSRDHPEIVAMAYPLSLARSIPRHPVVTIHNGSED